MMMLQRCDACPVLRMVEAKMSPAGRLLDRVLEVDFLVESHFQVSLSEVRADEIKGLQILKEERHKFSEEKMKK